MVAVSGDTVNEPFTWLMTPTEVTRRSCEPAAAVFETTMMVEPVPGPAATVFGTVAQVAPAGLTARTAGGGSTHALEVGFTVRPSGTVSSQPVVDEWYTTSRLSGSSRV